MDAYYPALTKEMTWAMGIALKKAAEDPEYLESDECPYGPEVRSFLTQMLGQSGLTVTVEGVGDADGGGEEEANSGAFLQRETLALYRKFKNMGTAIPADDTDEQLKYVKTASAMLEKLLTMEERAKNIRKVGEFHATVVSVLEEHLSPDQRTSVLEKLKAIAAGDTE